MIRFLIFILLTALITLNLGQAQTIKSEPSESLKQLLKKHRLNQNDVSLVLIELLDNKIVDQFQSDIPFVPASLMKVPTCHYALETLGPRYTFQTQLLTTGKTKGNSLVGDLILRGEGDPFLTATQLFNMALQLKIKGIKKVTGEFYYDESLFAPIAQISSLGSGDQTYNPAVGPLNIEFNRIRIQKTPVRGSTENAEFRPLPHLDFLKIEKTTKPFESRQKFLHSKQKDLIEKWLVSTQNKYAAFEELPIRKPGLFAASLFHFFASNLGIEISDPKPYEKKKTQGQLFYSHASHSLLQLCEMSLEYSNNLFAEALLITAALKMNPQIKSLESAGDLMKKWYHQKYPDLDFQNAYFENGSGLSLKSRLNAMSLAKLLQKWQGLQYQNKTFWSLLSLAGQSGWLRNRLHSDALAFRVFAKTGSLDFAHNMTGYLTGSGEKNYSFAIMVSDMERRESIEKEGNSRKRQALLREANNYRQRANDFADELLEKWSKL